MNGFPEYQKFIEGEQQYERPFAERMNRFPGYYGSELSSQPVNMTQNTGVNTMEGGYNAAQPAATEAAGAAGAGYNLNPALIMGGAQAVSTLFSSLIQARQQEKQRELDAELEKKRSRERAFQERIGVERAGAQGVNNSLQSLINVFSRALT